ncbi:antitoxin [Sphingobium baderi]|uniref:antitoxin n=1 Tax=Sphingobium baderi TaxID=1332080 RepID=UPI002B417F6B|nr:antitoxin [Sphingobium baderi]WRD77828.1 antitoxin [Sphingobium baderi]
MSRLTIDLTDQQHQNLKAAAKSQGKTIKQYVIERLFPADVVEDVAWRELKELLGQRVAEGLAGGTSAKSIDAMVDEELGSSHPDT